MREKCQKLYKEALGMYLAKILGAIKKITNELIRSLSATGSRNLPKSVT